MIYILDTITGFVVVFRLPGLMRRRASDYPHVDAKNCEAWLRADLDSAYAHVLMSFLALVAGVLLLLSWSAIGQMSADPGSGLSNPSIPLFVLAGVAWVGVSVWKGILSAKAKELKARAGIQ